MMVIGIPKTFFKLISFIINGISCENFVVHQVDVYCLCLLVVFLIVYIYNIDTMRH